jgi:hypothetical protein
LQNQWHAKPAFIAAQYFPDKKVPFLEFFIGKISQRTLLQRACCGLLLHPPPTQPPSSGIKFKMF